MRRFLGAVATITMLTGCGAADDASSIREADAQPTSSGSNLPTPSVTPTPERGRIEHVSPKRPDPLSIPSWGRSFEGTEFQYGYSRRLEVATDRFGNVFLAGDFRGSVNLGGEPLESQGQGDILVAKFDIGGNLLWSKRFGDSADQIFSGLAVDRDGNVILTGVFDGELDFGAGPLTADYLNVFIAKLGPKGEPVWGKRFGSAETVQWATAITTDDDGDVIFAGNQEGTVDYGGLSLKTKGTFIVTVKFDPCGAPIWGKTFSGSTDQEVTSIAADATGDVVVAGTTKWSTIDGVPLGGKGQMDVFAVKWDADGKLRWAESFGDKEDQRLEGMGLDGQGGVVLSGTFRGTLDFPGAPLRADPKAASESFFVAKLDSSGHARYSRAFETGGALAVDSKGNAFIAASLEGKTSYGALPVTSEGAHDVVIVKLDASGDPVATRRAGDALDQTAGAIAVDPTGAVVVLGRFAGNMNLGTGELASASGQDIFLAKLP
jgi:hypothetical protein